MSRQDRAHRRQIFGTGDHLLVPREALAVRGASLTDVRAHPADLPVEGVKPVSSRRTSTALHDRPSNRLFPSRLAVEASREKHRIPEVQRMTTHNDQHGAMPQETMRCPTCGAEFRSQTELEQHKKQAHPSE